MTELTQTSVGPLLVALVAVLLFAVRAQMLASRSRAELHALQHDRIDPLTKLLPQTAIPLRLEPELAWAEYEGKAVGIAVFHARGNHPERAARGLRVVMRGAENAYLMGADRFLVGLWDTTEEGAAIAVQRLGSAMQRPGRELVDAGMAMFPRDGRDLEELVALAQQQMRPLDEQPLPGSRKLTPRSALRRGADTMANVLPGLAIAAIPLLLSYQLLGSPGEGSVALASLLLAPLAAAAFAWNWVRGARTEPRSAGAQDVAAWPLGLVALAAGTVLLAPFALGGTGAVPLVAVVIFHLWLALLVLVHGRHLVRIDGKALAAVVLAAAALVWLTYEDLPGLANAGRIAVAMSLGSLVARAFERVWWVIPVSVAIALVDIWSVFAEGGVTRKLLEAEESGTGGALAAAPSLLFFQGPPLGESLYSLGTTDFVFASLFLAVTHLWRLPLLRTVLALLVGLSITFVAAWVVFERGLPALPLLSLAFLAAHFRYLFADVTDALRKEVPDSTRRGVGAASGRQVA